MVTKELCPEVFGAALPSYVVTPNAAMPIPRSRRARLTFVYSVHLQEASVHREHSGRDMRDFRQEFAATVADQCRLSASPIEAEEYR